MHGSFIVISFLEQVLFLIQGKIQMGVSAAAPSAPLRPGPASGRGLQLVWELDQCGKKRKAVRKRDTKIPCIREIVRADNQLIGARHCAESLE